MYPTLISKVQKLQFFRQNYNSELVTDTASNFEVRSNINNMGVRGLTTFIAQNSNKYLRKYELHDTYLVIDGNNLAAQLYKWHTTCYDCFGGDYDKYERTVVMFFRMLHECNIIPLIVFDGGYEDKKLKTVYTRVKTRINQAKCLNCTTESSMTVFPLFLRELFVEITLKMNLKVVRCLVEADYEMACIARKLKCPLLSYDSDFFIFDVDYIPFNSVCMTGAIRKSDIKFVQCKIYKVEYFLKEFGGMTKDCLPLLGALLGNDYIKARVFSNFYQHLKLGKKKTGKSDQQRRIKAVIEWLRNENFESALRKILGRVKKVRRKLIAKQIMSITESYICSDSELISHLNLTNVNGEVKKSEMSNIDIDGMCEADTESEGSEDESEESSDDAEMPEAEKIMKPENSRPFDELPKFFEDRYKKCVYPATFIDMIFHNRYIFIPHIEDYSLPTSSHNISLPIMSAIYKMLSLEKTYKLKYITRNERSKIASFYLEKSKLELPSLKDLESISKDNALKSFYDVLAIDQKTQKIINDFPMNWKLFILCLIYWIRNSSPKVNNCHVYALILAALILRLDMSYIRDERKLQRCFEKEIRELSQTRPELVINNKISSKDAIKSITKNDGIMLLKETIVNFQMNLKLRKNPNQFDISIIHAFAQFQSCAFHVKYLNLLLNKPLQDYLISDFYNGTLIYNLCANFLNRKDLDAYMKILLQYSPGVYLAFTNIKMALALVTESWSTNVSTKRNRKRNRGKDKVNYYKSGEGSIEVEEPQEPHYDENNRFSLLTIVDQ